MHLIIGLLTAIASLLYALERLGIDIGWINPWAWKRRRGWQKQYNANPAFHSESPLEAVALLMTAITKVDGDLSSDEKAELLKLFEEELKQTSEDASALLRSSVFLLGRGEEVFASPEKVLDKCIDNFTDAQKATTIYLLTRMSEVSGSATSVQKAFISKVDGRFKGTPKSAENWG